MVTDPYVPKFFVRGVAYQVEIGVDPIADDYLPSLERDVLLFKELGLNTVYVFKIDNTKSHDKAMKLLEEAGIYVLTAVSSSASAINRLDPHRSYTEDALSSYFATVDVMARYPNTLGILAASMLTNNDATMSATPVLGAVVRDVKRYMQLKYEATGQRVLLVGYEAATAGARDRTIMEFLTLGTQSETIDFWTCCNFSSPINDSDPAQFCYNDLTDQLRPATVPIFFSEYGNAEHQPRLFQETKALYSPEMCRSFSGGLRANDPSKVYEKRERTDGVLLIYHDFQNYKAQLAANPDPPSTVEETEDELVERRSGATAETSWPWEPEFQVPESCVDWRQIEELVRGEA